MGGGSSRSSNTNTQASSDLSQNRSQQLSGGAVGNTGDGVVSYTTSSTDHGAVKGAFAFGNKALSANKDTLTNAFKSNENTLTNAFKFGSAAMYQTGKAFESAVQASTDAADMVADYTHGSQQQQKEASINQRWMIGAFAAVILILAFLKRNG